MKDTRVGDTITEEDRPASEPLPGYKKATPMVYCGLYPIETNQYEDLRDALEKLQLNDASLLYEPETSTALGFGFRCGFLGLLHMEIVKERLEREYDLQLITTAPSVIYQVIKTDGEVMMVDNPTNLPDSSQVEAIEEPYVEASIIVPSDYVGSVMELCQEKRGQFDNMEYVAQNRVVMTYTLPLSEIIFDFFDALKSRTRGYASFDYEFKGYFEADLVKLDIMINGEVVDALSCIVHKEKAYYRGRVLAQKLRKLIPRQLLKYLFKLQLGIRSLPGDC